MRYGEVDAVDGVTFVAQRGEVLVVLGPNGAGKTTTLEILETLAVLGGWTVAGAVLAPPVLRRMARRESGSAVAERRQAAMQRVA
jgi:ABC-type multidrug transport system ATPase subunit